MKLRRYELVKESIGREMTIALATDLHDREGSEALAVMEREKPDLIAVAGDLTQRLDLPSGADGGVDGRIDHGNAFSFLKRAAAIAPTFYSLGNHEMGSRLGEGGSFSTGTADANLALIRDLGVILLRGETVMHEGIAICGIDSGYANPDRIPDLSPLKTLCGMDAFRLLLCHHPEYYPDICAMGRVDLMLSGHTHGGQIRLLGRGLYSPGQGILPKYDGGLFENRLVVSRGLANTVMVPRFCNPTELVLIRLRPAV